MPHIDPVAKQWEESLSGRMGKAVQRRRKRLGLTAQQLAERTSELKYPITRVAISKIEGNKRSGKFDVAEWLVLSQALSIPPALLLFPDYPDGIAEGLPGQEGSGQEGSWWVSGVRRGGVNDGVELVDLVEQRAELHWELNHLVSDQLVELLMSGDSDEVRTETEKALNRQIRNAEAQLAIVEAEIVRAKEKLWAPDQSSEESSDDA